MIALGSWIGLKILLIILFRNIKLCGWMYLSNNCIALILLQNFDFVFDLSGNFVLILVMSENDRGVLLAHVRALLAELGWVVEAEKVVD